MPKSYVIYVHKRKRLLIVDATPSQISCIFYQDGWQHNWNYTHQHWQIIVWKLTRVHAPPRARPNVRARAAFQLTACKKVYIFRALTGMASLAILHNTVG